MINNLEKMNIKNFIIINIINIFKMKQKTKKKFI